MSNAFAGDSFCIDYSERPDPTSFLTHDLSIIHPAAKVDFVQAQKNGRRIFAYLSVVEIGPEAPYRKEALARKVNLVARNEVWNSDLVDVSDTAWTQFVVGKLAADIVTKGFDGFFLDTVDSIDTLSRKHPARAEAYRRGLINLVKTLKGKYPTKQIILNRGFNVWEDLREQIDGLLVESLFQTYDYKNKTYAGVNTADTEWLLATLRKVKMAGIPVYVVDYVDPLQPLLAEATAKKIELAGFSAFITTPELMGRTLAFFSEMPRYLLVLCGSPGKEGAFWTRQASDSYVAQAVQMPLEWLGYEVDYLNPSVEPLPRQLEAKYAGVILDSTLELPPPEEAEIATWLVQQKTRGLKVIFLGVLPFHKTEPRALILREFGFGGTGESLADVTNLEPTAMSKEMNYEARINLLRTPFLDLRAPAGANLWLSVGGQDGQGKSRQYDAVFVTGWGGVLLRPYMTFLRPDGTDLWLVDPFEFCGRALSLPDWPTPDATTRDGVRALFAHIDGDGFRHVSSVDLGKRSAEVVFERIVKKYPFPFTCSVIEAEIRGWVHDQKLGDQEELMPLARAIFACPKVSAASHTYSHPFYWVPNDRTAKRYEEGALRLKSPHQAAELDLSREIAGSVQFIEQSLLPTNKRVEIFLWSGNCRPAPAAVRLTRELGIENLNGGGATISRKHPTVSRVAPRCMPFANELQIYSPSANENIYWDRLNYSAGEQDPPFYGGLFNLVDTLRRTDSPRRLEPANIYFHYFSGDNWASLNALTAVFDWAVRQELHALTAAQYARIVRDCRVTRLFRKSDQHWLLLNDGSLRTYRLRGNQLVPDLAASRGVTGYRVVSDAVYVHTDGSPRVELVLSAHPPPHVYLVSSTAEIRFEQLRAEAALFSTQDLRPGQVTLGGFPPGTRIEVTVNDDVSFMTTDTAGQLPLSLPSQARVRVQPE